MMNRRFPLLALALACGTLPAGHAQGQTQAPAQAEAPADPLRIIMVDVEGGAAALYITPEGHSVLIDAGWPAGVGGGRPAAGQPAPEPRSDATRIVAAARAAGLTRIDYLVVTHYHIDHVGGVADLLAQIPVGVIIDHGPNREEPVPGLPPARFPPSILYPAYLEAIAGRERRLMQAGDTLEIDGLSLLAVVGDRVVVDGVNGEPAAGIGCADIVAKVDDEEEENPRSLGFLMSWGAARLLALGDITWNLENQIVCPDNRLGAVDLYVADNHGSGISNSPVFLRNIDPRVVLFQNGTRKGADVSTFEAVRALPGLQALWQMHETERVPESNEPPAHIANLAGGTDGHPLQIYVARDAAITVVNPRIGHSETYPPR